MAITENQIKLEQLADREAAPQWSGLRSLRHTGHGMFPASSSHLLKEPEAAMPKEWREKNELKISSGNHKCY